MAFWIALAVLAAALLTHRGRLWILTSVATLGCLVLLALVVAIFVPIGFLTAGMLAGAMLAGIGAALGIAGAGNALVVQCFWAVVGMATIVLAMDLAAGAWRMVTRSRDEPFIEPAR